ncbi:hypothetical protein [Rhizobium multihospitium]|uniref:hypothetical protein n=1 Tax=Rhizobium multihospitium TaxID=410764 RepID=UPI0013B03340|nr:hypothetical protein [Rhizobium multihospitium]
MTTIHNVKMPDRLPPITLTMIITIKKSEKASDRPHACSTSTGQNEATSAD